MECNPPSRFAAMSKVETTIQTGRELKLRSLKSSSNGKQKVLHESSGKITGSWLRKKRRKMQYCNKKGKRSITKPCPSCNNKNLLLNQGNLGKEAARERRGSVVVGLCDRLRFRTSALIIEGADNSRWFILKIIPQSCS